MSTTKNRRKHYQDSKLLFFKINLLFGIRLSIYIWKTKFSSHKHYLFGLLFSRNAKKTMQTKVYYQLFYCLKRNISQTLKSSSCKKSFPSVYIMDTTCFDECFLFRVITGRHSFLYKLIVTQRLHVTTLLLCSLKQVF